jgi:hypothetical protein
MLRALLAHPQEAPHKPHLVYCVRVMSVGCSRIGVDSTSILVQPTDITRNIPSAVCATSPVNGQVMLETCRGP